MTSTDDLQRRYDRLRTHHDALLAALKDTAGFQFYRDGVAAALNVAESVRMHAAWGPDATPDDGLKLGLDGVKEAVRKLAKGIENGTAGRLRPSSPTPDGVIKERGEEKEAERALRDGLSQVEPASGLNPSDFDPSRGQWQPIETAPKDRPILAWCDHESDPRVIEKTADGRECLTLYAAHSEGLSSAPTGLHIVEWGGGFDDRSFEYDGGHLPDWWFVSGSEHEIAANPVWWMPLPPAPGIETEGQNPKGSGAKHESPVAYGEAPTSPPDTPSSQDSGVGESEGWVLLPREPTQEMWAAFRNADPTGITFDRGYRAMIEAAPRPSQREG